MYSANRITLDFLSLWSIWATSPRREHNAKLAKCVLGFVNIHPISIAAIMNSTFFLFHAALLFIFSKYDLDY